MYVRVYVLIYSCGAHQTVYITIYLHEHHICNIQPPSRALIEAFSSLSYPKCPLSFEIQVHHATGELPPFEYPSTIPPLPSPLQMHTPHAQPRYQCRYTRPYSASFIPSPHCRCTSIISGSSTNPLTTSAAFAIVAPSTTR